MKLFSKVILRVIHLPQTKNREGFAIGAIIAAEFLYNKKGLFSMKDVVKF